MEEKDIFEDSTFWEDFNNCSFDLQETKKNNDQSLNISALCCDEEISGYDKSTGKTWIYPTNYPVRDYQFNIIKAAILQNTLVSLPTGLGKTFIAAVIMYNFYRWYPLGKIIFTAPTKPLVAQQIEACYNIIAIPPDDTIEMTGHMQVTTRKAHWEKKRVFFATPQVIYNDLKSGTCPSDKIRCLVIDEAHKAKGNYAYCQIVSLLNTNGNKVYRILALSATPGSKIKDVIQVVKNLNIAHLELRTENCIDVAQYSHSRQIRTIVVELGSELTQLKQQYLQILDVYARRLKQLNILPNSLGNLSKGHIVMLYKDYQTRDRENRHPQHNQITKDLTYLIALFHGLELLTKHGSRVFLNFFDEHPEKTWIQIDHQLTALLERLRDDLGINPLSLDISNISDSSIPEIPSILNFGHPKFDKLKEIMLEHFNKAKENNQDTRAIVFCEYRESVNLVNCLLLQCRPLIKPQMFVGQGASGKEGKRMVSQKQQLRAMQRFRAGDTNALVATCVAEEGLDVGAVDLIVCFDISTRSPIRLIQRCGRTGREREGRVFILVTEGKEHQTLMDCMKQRDVLNKKIQQSQEVKNSLYKSSPRMIPHGFIPTCQKMYITVAKKNLNIAKKSKSKKAQKDLKNMLQLHKSAKSSLEKTDSKESENSPQKSDFLSNAKDELLYDKEHKYMDVKKSSNINNSLNAGTLSLLNDCSEEREKEKPVQVSDKLENKNKKQQKRSPLKKDGDIRALFTTAKISTKNYTKLINDFGIQTKDSLPTNLLNLFVELNSNISNDKTTDCFICSNICDCKFLKGVNKRKQSSFIELKALELPDDQTIGNVDPNLILEYIMTNNELENNETVSKDKSKQNINSEVINLDNSNAMSCFDIVTDEKNKSALKRSSSFDFGSVDDILLAINSEEMLDMPESENKVYDTKEKTTEIIEPMELASAEDIFAELDCENSIDESNMVNDYKPKTPPSPSILSGIQKHHSPPKSPILMSQSIHQKVNSSDHSLLTITEIIGMINKSINLSQDSTPKSTNKLSTNQRSINKSPILFTQKDKLFKQKSQSKSSLLQPNCSLIILDSDSDSNEVEQLSENTQHANFTCSINDSTKNRDIRLKRKSDDNDTGFINSQAHFRKRIKTNEHTSTPKISSNKENILPINRKDNLTTRHSIKDLNESNIERKSPKATSFKSANLDSLLADESDDDFEVKETNLSTLMKDKRKKTAKVNNSFIDAEVSVSDGNSEDESSDTSIGSIVDFICDDTQNNDYGTNIMYLKSIKSPVKGKFKIPDLPRTFDRDAIFSQEVEEDSYQIDSFCVDSNAILTQVNDLSELEVAEKKLEKTKSKKIGKKKGLPTSKNGRKKKINVLYSDSDQSE